MCSLNHQGQSRQHSGFLRSAYQTEQAHFFSDALTVGVSLML